MGVPIIMELGLYETYADAEFIIKISAQVASARLLGDLNELSIQTANDVANKEMPGHPP